MLLRSAPIDKRLGPFVNKATNPRFKRAVAGSTVVRRNLVRNPRGLNSGLTTDFARFTGAAKHGLTIAYEQTAESRSDWTSVTLADAVGTTSIARVQIEESKLVVGALYSGSFLAHNPSDSATISITADLFDGTPFTPVVLNPGETRTIKVEGVPCMTSTKRWMDFTILSSEVGKTVLVTDALIEQRPVALPYFDGDTPDALGFDYAWEGTAGASTSVVKSAVVEVRRNLATSPFGLGPMDGYNGAETVTSGVAVTDHPEGISSAARVSYTAGLGNTGAILTYGSYPVNDTSATYTLSAWVKVESGDTGTFALALIGQAVGGLVVNPAVGVWSKLTWSITPTSSRRAGLRLGGVTTQSGSFLVTGVVIEKTTAVLPLFSGSMTPDADLIPAWTGTPDASESVLYGIRPSDVNIPSSANKLFASYDGGVAFNSVVSGDFDIIANIPTKPGETWTVLVEGTMLEVPSYEFMTGLRTWGGVVTQERAELPMTVGPFSVRQHIPISEGTTSSTFRLWPLNNALSGKFPLRMERVLIVRGVYNGPYFDGDDDRVVWRGTPHASESAGYPSLESVGA